MRAEGRAARVESEEMVEGEPWKADAAAGRVDWDWVGVPGRVGTSVAGVPGWELVGTSTMTPEEEEAGWTTGSVVGKTGAIACEVREGAARGW